MLETVTVPTTSTAKWSSPGAAAAYDDAWTYGDAGGYPTFARELAPVADRAAGWEWATPAECAPAELAAVQAPDRPEPRATAVIVGVAIAWHVVGLLNG